MRVFAPIALVSSRRVGAITAAFALVGLAGCLDLRTTKDACTVTVAPASLSIPVNGSAPIVGTAFDCDGNSIRNKRISYSSNNSTVATVTTEGVVLAIGVGAATVSVVADDKTASVPVIVTPEVAATVTVTPGVLTLRRTNTRQLSAVARNSQNIVISGRVFRWSSSNSSIAAVDQNGTVSALTAGNVIITAESDQTVGSAAISVTEIPIGSCSLAPASTRLTVGQGTQPSLTLRDTAGNALPLQGRGVVWTSDNETVATVSQSGLVATRRAGSATITASPIENAQVRCSATVEAVDPRIAQVVVTPRTGSLRIGIPRGFGAALLDSTNAQVPAGRIVTWSTNTPTVIAITQAGIATGIALGTARVIATSEGVADTVTFPVTRIPVASVSVAPLQVTVLEGQSTQLRATVTDSVGTEITDRPIEWITSDPTRATVSQTGLVTAIAAGNVNIGATVEGRLAQGTVIIRQTPVDSIVTQGTFTVTRGLTSAFAITVRDAAGITLRNRNIVVTSDFPGVAIGQPNAQSTLVQVSGLTVGTATLTLQAVDSNNRNEGKPSTVVITVVLPPTTPLRQSGASAGSR